MEDVEKYVELGFEHPDLTIQRWLSVREAAVVVTLLLEVRHIAIPARYVLVVMRQWV